MDKKMFFAFYNFAQSRRRFGKAARFIDRYCPYLFAAVFLGFCFYLLISQLYIEFFLYTGVPLVTLIISRVVRRVVQRERPCQAFGITDSPHSGRTSYSFPSNHTASASAIAFACLYINAEIGLAMFVFTAVTALSRLFTGAHYTTDVVAGFMLGTFTAAVGFNLIPVFLIL